MLSVLIRAVRSYSACFITTDTPEAPDHRSSRTKWSFHSDNYAPSRYHTNCLTYFLKAYDFALCGLYHHPSSRRRSACYLFCLNKSSTFVLSLYGDDLLGSIVNFTRRLSIRSISE